MERTFSVTFSFNLAANSISSTRAEPTTAASATRATAAACSGVRMPKPTATGLPCAVGFGIRSPEQAEAVARVADGVVVGSALVDEIAAAVKVNENVTARVLLKASELAKAVRSARLELA